MFYSINLQTIPAEPTAEGETGEIYHHPETGERISKNAFKKLQKGVPLKKEKKEKIVPVPSEKKKEKKTTIMFFFTS